MRLATVIGSVTATAKDPQLVGQKLLICDCIKADGTVTESALVCIDTVGAGTGDQVLLVFGSAARMLGGSASAPVDAAICAIVDQVSVPSRK
jgi:microcompartment protein CcmK/EutM